MTHFLHLVSVQTVLDFIQSFPSLPSEEIPLADALGRVVAEPIIAQENLPGFARSTMDGFAVAAQDVFGASEGLPALLTYAGECPMGQTPDIQLQAGSTAKIWTGGMLPQGADAVVMLEYAREAGTTCIELTRPVAPGENVIQPDEDAAQGQLLLAPGKALRVQDLGLLAALGQPVVTVHRRPRVAIISTGDEVIPLEQTPLPGQVRDVNATTLAALAQQEGATGRFFGHCADDPQVLQALLSKALAWADIVLVSGGSSAGQRDFTLESIAAQKNTSIFAHGVAISPGKPLIVAQCGTQSIWGMPGHVASALICGHVFIAPLIRQLSGRCHKTDAVYPQLKAQLTRPVSSTIGRQEYIRVALSPAAHENEAIQATPIRGKSGLISTLVQAQALIICPEDSEGFNAHDIVDVYLLS